MLKSVRFLSPIRDRPDALVLPKTPLPFGVLGGGAFPRSPSVASPLSPYPAYSNNCFPRTPTTPGPEADSLGASLAPTPTQAHATLVPLRIPPGPGSKALPKSPYPYALTFTNITPILTPINTNLAAPVPTIAPSQPSPVHSKLPKTPYPGISMKSLQDELMDNNNSNKRDSMLSAILGRSRRRSVRSDNDKPRVSWYSLSASRSDASIPKDKDDEPAATTTTAATPAATSKAVATPPAARPKWNRGGARSVSDSLVHPGGPPRLELDLSWSERMELGDGGGTGSTCTAAAATSAVPVIAQTLATPSTPGSAMSPSSTRAIGPKSASNIPSPAASPAPSTTRAPPVRAPKLRRWASALNTRTTTHATQAKSLPILKVALDDTPSPFHVDFSRVGRASSSSTDSATSTGKAAKDAAVAKVAKAAKAAKRATIQITPGH